MKHRHDLKILLLQIRNNHHVRKEELNSFAYYGQLLQNQISVLNVFDQPNFDPSVIDEYDAVFVGGASEAPCTDETNYPFITKCKKLLLYCIEINKPVLASCYGFQLVVLALGGNIIHVDTGFEMGSIPITLTDAAKKDPIFGTTPNIFLAISVHQDKAVEAPLNCTTLAYTEQCIHAFRVNNKHIWCTQFHPEVDKSILVERLTHFKDKYTNNTEHLHEILTNAKETPDSNILVKKFIDYILTI